MQTRNDTSVVFILLSLLLFSEYAVLRGEEVRWQQIPQSAAADASRLQRPIVVYVTAKNCMYCRKMERDTWQDLQVVSHVTEDWVPLKVDAEGDRKLAEAFQVHIYPTTLLYTHDRRLISRLEGFFSPDLLRESLRKARAVKRSNTSILH